MSGWRYSARREIALKVARRLINIEETVLDSVGGRLRYFRKLRAMTMAELADRVGCSESFVSKIEAGKGSPSINMLHRLSQILETNIGELFSRGTQSDDIVLRSGERPMIQDDIRKGHKISLERLLNPARDRLLQANLHHLAPGAASEGLIAHAGEEFGYVLEGTIELMIGDGHHLLNAGDTFHFSSERPHGYRNAGSAPARILWVNTPPTY